MTDRDTIIQTITANVTKHPIGLSVQQHATIATIADAVLAAIGDRLLPELHGVSYVEVETHGIDWYVAYVNGEPIDPVDGSSTEYEGTGTSIVESIRNALEAHR